MFFNSGVGTQRKIAETIIENKADYILALKGNQKNLREEVESIFKVQYPDDSIKDVDKGHGRIEIRKCEIIKDLKFLDGKEKWKNLS